MGKQLEFQDIEVNSEVKLLICCARTQMDAANAERIIRLLQDSIDWDSLLRRASRHNLVPLLYQSLEAVAPKTIPQAIRVEFRKQIQVILQGNLFLTKELLHIQALFIQQGIPAVPYKGPVLATQVYGGLALRPFNDLDILVHERDILRAMDLLVSNGYQLIRPAVLAQTEKSLQSYWINQMVKKSAWAYQLVLWHPDRQALVELHWRITPKYIFPNNPEQLWERLTPIPVGKFTALTFAPENLLWFLCVHGTKHRWKRLNWLCDIAELIRTFPHLDWEQVTTQVTTLGIERRLYLGLYLANSILEAPLPEAIEAKIDTIPHLKILAQQVMERISNEKEQTTRLSYLERFAFQLRAMDRMADRGRYLLRFAKGERAFWRL